MALTDRQITRQTNTQTDPTDYLSTDVDGNKNEFQLKLYNTCEPTDDKIIYNRQKIDFLKI